MTTLVVGDVHGCADELAELVALARASRVILLGDLFTKGPDPVGVWKQVCAGGFEAIEGNHEARLRDVVEGSGRGDPGAVQCVEELDAGALGWREWTMALPRVVEVGGWTLIHAGLDPSGELEQTTRHQALFARRHPDASPHNPHWHDVYRGTRRVLFGHDAVEGLVYKTREGRPWIVGLDTGCVYGGALTGMLLEEEALISVAARRAYVPVRRRREPGPPR